MTPGVRRREGEAAVTLLTMVLMALYALTAAAVIVAIERYVVVPHVGERFGAVLFFVLLLSSGWFALPVSQWVVKWYRNRGKS